MAESDPGEFDAPLSIQDEDATAGPAAAGQGQGAGFLPIQTNWFDRVFISVVIWVALCLIWLRFLEPAGLSLNFAHLIAIALGAFIVWRG